MLVYYFVPFIVSNRYLLFWVSNGHNSVNVQNRTRVYMNFFDHEDLGNHFLQLCPKVVKHPVYMIMSVLTFVYIYVWMYALVMYVCVYVCMYVLMYNNAYMCVSMYICMCVWIFVWVSLCMYLCNYMCVRMCVRIYVLMTYMYIYKFYAFIYLRKYVPVCIMRVCVCVWLHIYICMYCLRVFVYICGNMCVFIY